MRTFAAVVIALAIGLAGCGDDDTATDDTTADDSQPPVELFFVLTGQATVSSDELEVMASDVDWFTASPARRAGTESLDRFVTRWEREFGHDAPNAAISGPNGLDAELTLHAATGVADGVRFETSILRGALPPGELGEVSLFVDPATDTVTSTPSLVTFDDMAFAAQMTCGEGERVVVDDVAIEGEAVGTSPASSTLSVTSGTFQLTTSSIDRVETQGGLVALQGSAEFTGCDSNEMTADFALRVPVDGEGRLWSSLEDGPLVLSVQAQSDPLLVAIATVEIGAVR